MTRIAGDWLSRHETQAVFDALGEAWFVGGVVRNALLGDAVTDIDVATPLKPEKVIELATAAGLHAVPTGIDHGTVTVVSAGLPHEVTTFRRDVETEPGDSLWHSGARDPRHPVLSVETADDR